MVLVVLMTNTDGIIADSTGVSKSIKATPNKEYTLRVCTGLDLVAVVVSDTDVPYPNGGVYIHMVETNIPKDDLAKGTTVLSWHPPTPPAGDPAHTYHIHVLSQAAPLSLPTPERHNGNLGILTTLPVVAYAKFRAYA